MMTTHLQACRAYLRHLFESIYMYWAAGVCLPVLQENGYQIGMFATQAHAVLQTWYITAAKI